MKLNKAPCKDCTKRTIGCHSSCKEYQEWAKQKKEISEQLKKEKDYFPNFPKPETYAEKHSRRLHRRHSNDD